MASNDLSFLPWTIAICVGTYFLVRIGLIARSAYTASRAGPRLPSGAYAVLWRDPGAVDKLDLLAGPGGRESIPVPPLLQTGVKRFFRALTAMGLDRRPTFGVLANSGANSQD